MILMMWLNLTFAGDSKAQFDDVNAQVRRIAAEVDGVTQALSRLEDNLQQVLVTNNMLNSLNTVYTKI